ncbi:MAG: pyridoxamine 5'-phosphate oxidase family protein [Halorubrum sp.]
MTTRLPGDGHTHAGPTLYLESADIDPRERVCSAIFADAERSDYRVVQLTSERSFESIHDAFDAQLEAVADPSAAAVIIMTPNAADDTTVSEVGDDVPFYGLRVDPQDLTGISVAFSRLLERWEDAQGETKICLRNVESLLPYHETDLVYRFLNTVLATLQGAGADVHAHLNREMIDDRTQTLLSSLFDRVVDADDASATEGGAGTEPAATQREETAPDDEAGIDEETAEILAGNGHGVLAFEGSPPYALPISYGYEADSGRIVLQLSDFEGSTKRDRLAASSRVSLVVTRYADPDRWESAIVDGRLRSIDDLDIDEADVLDAYADSDMASVDVFEDDLDKASFAWFVLEPTAVNARRSAVTN